MEHSNERNLQGKKVLITGGLGFIGSNLVQRCLELGAQVTIYDNLAPYAGGNLYNIHGIQNAVEVCYYDILDYDRLLEHIVGKDIIFNCAASSSHPLSLREPWSDLDINSRAVINLLEVLRRFNPEAKFVQIGTSTQLGRLQYTPADENHPEFPLDLYSANKSVSEKYTLIYAHVHKLRATVIRLSNVYGPRARINNRETTFNNYFIGLALQDKEISIFGDGAQKRNLIYVEDVVEALLAAAVDEKSNGETFFAVGDEHFSVADIAKTIVNVIGRGSVRFVPWPDDRKPTEVGDAVLSNQKIRNTLGWVPRVEFRDGLACTQSYFVECMEKYL